MPPDEMKSSARCADGRGKHRPYEEQERQHDEASGAEPQVSSREDRANGT